MCNKHPVMIRNLYIVLILAFILQFLHMERMPASTTSRQRVGTSAQGGAPLQCYVPTAVLNLFAKTSYAAVTDCKRLTRRARVTHYRHERSIAVRHRDDRIPIP